MEAVHVNTYSLLPFLLDAVLDQKCSNSFKSYYLSALTHVLFHHSLMYLPTDLPQKSLGMLSGNQRLFSLSSLGSFNLIMAILLFLYKARFVFVTYKINIAKVETTQESISR